MAALSTGCVTGKGWQGLIPDKDVEIVNPIITLMTPYGQQTLRADRIATRLGASTNALPPLVATPLAPPGYMLIPIPTNNPVAK